MANTRIEDAIRDALLGAFTAKDEEGYETTTFGSAFFRTWLKEGGNAYTFLFHKNLRITNMQHAELNALLSTNTFEVATSNAVRSLQFVSSHDLVATLDALLHGVPSAPSLEDRPTDDEGKKALMNQWATAAEWFAQTYAHMLYYTVVYDAFYGSASVYLPAHLDINLAAICGRAGYVHSCGRNVFVRNVSKARLDHFSKAIDRHLQRYRPADEKGVFFTVFAHEEFDPYETQKAPLRDGLDDVKIHIDKSFMGRKSLVEVAAELREAFKGRLDVAEPDHFAQRAGFRTRTMWLISDYGIQRQLADGDECLAKSRKRYYICYDQLYDNQNPFQFFDENKPAWVAHTTIPHMLMAAMINVTAPSWSGKSALLVDPFVGSGTTWVEACKYPELTVISGDKSSLAVTAAIDNARFFAHRPETLRRIATIISAVAESIKDPTQQVAIQETYGDLTGAAVADHVPQVREWMRPDAITDEAAEKFLRGQENEVSRILFYLLLRTHRRHEQALRRHAQNWKNEFARAFRHEAAALAEQIKLFAALKSKLPNTTIAASLCVCPGDFSDSVSVAVETLEKLRQRNGAQVPKVRNAEELGRLAEEHGKFNIIITDPPYGFNTDEDSQALAILYRDVIRAAVSTLAPDGQLVICLPERSTIGKDPAAFTHHRIVTHQVLAFAAEIGREVLVPARSLPGPVLAFQPPYYWVSDRLQRSILHFKIR